MSKVIRIKNWPNKEFSPDQFTQTNGVGIKTGNGLVAIDIDVYDPKIAAEITQAAFQELGPTFARVGQAPKIALLYRNAEMTSKIELPVQPTGEAPVKKIEAIEVLATGQQLVAAAIHPETKRPYSWDGTTPWSPITGHIKNLPLIDAATWQKFHSSISHLLVQESFMQHAAVKQSGTQNRSLGNDSPSTAEVQKILSYIPSTLDYNSWVLVTMGLKSLGEQYRSLWLNWSATGQNHNPSVDPAKWGDVSPTGGVSFATVCQLAREAGADLSAIAKKHKGKSGPKKTSGTKDEEVPGRTFEELLAAARTISKDDVEGIEQLIAETLKINSIRRETIYSALKDSTGYTLTAIRKQRSEFSEAIPSLDQLDLAKKTISRLGADNILHSSGLTWLWENVGVWKAMEDRPLSNQLKR
jgi:hypothetical protein